MRKKNVMCVCVCVCVCRYIISKLNNTVDSRITPVDNAEQSGSRTSQVLGYAGHGHRDRIAHV